MPPADHRDLTGRLGSPPAIALTLALVVVVAGSLGLGQFGLWRDEAFSAQLASLPPALFLRFVTSQEPNGSLYHGMLFGWVLIGAGETFLRLPSVIFAAASVTMTFLLGRRLVGQRAAVVGALVLAGNAMVLGFAQEARSYALFLLTSTASSLLFTRAILDDDRLARRCYPFVAAAAMYAHYFAALTIIAQFASLAMVGRRWQLWRRMLPGALLTGLLTAPLLAFTLSDRPDSLTWIPPTTLLALEQTFLSLLGGRTMAVVAAALAVAAVVLWRGQDQRAPDDMGIWPLGLLLASTATPLLVGVSASLAKPLLVDRYFAAVLPPLFLLVASGAARLDRRVFANWPVTAVCLVALAAALLSTRHFPLVAKPDSRGAVAHVMAHAHAGDAVVPAFWGIPAYQWYGVRRNPGAARQLDFVFPEPDPNGLVSDELWRGDFLVRSTPVAFDPTPARAAVRRHARVWTINDGGGADIRSVMEQGVLLRILDGKHECGQWSFRGVIVRLYADRCRPSRAL